VRQRTDIKISSDALDVQGVVASGTVTGLNVILSGNPYSDVGNPYVFISPD
jgi:hypothetical protein